MSETLVAPESLQGARVRLRPLRPDDVDVLERGMAAADEMSAPAGAPPRTEFVRRVDAGGRLDERGSLDLGIEVDGRLIGDIQARQPKHGLPPGAFELGISIFERSDRGKGHGAEAVALMASFLFESGANRVQVSTDVSNGAMRAVLERMGFALEGVMRSFMPSSAGPRDYAMYAINRTDWENLKETWTTRS